MSLSHDITSLTTSCRREVPGCLAAGVTDMSTGMLLSLDTLDHHPAQIIEMLAAATADLFQGRTVRQIEDLWSQHRGTNTEGHLFQEILIYSTHLLHLFLRSRRSPDLVVTLACPLDANIGMVLVQSRAVLREFDAA